MDIFQALAPFKGDLENKCAIAVSGGGDSMALCAAITEALPDLSDIHILTIDHNMRKDSADEALNVQKYITSLGYQHHTILTRNISAITDTKLQESARHDRYNMMAEYCKENNIKTLFLAHHQNDQAETVLFRLAKGSGLDGLSGMQAIQPYDSFLNLCRPFLAIPKSALIQYCQDNNISFIKDPSNQNESFARIRLRKAYEVLAKEGLNDKRLSVTASRLRRARTALDFYTGKAMEQHKISLTESSATFNYTGLKQCPAEIRLRVILQMWDILPFHDKGNTFSTYGPRMEKAERLVNHIFHTDNFKKSTLGGLIFSLDREKTVLTIEQEHKNATLGSGVKQNEKADT